VGWSVGGSEHYNDEEERDRVESEAICNLIEKEIAPLYYDRDENDIPVKWVDMMKKSIQVIVPFFNTHRMVREYYTNMYVPAHRYGKKMIQENKAREVSAWRKKIADNWSHVNIENASTSVRQKTEIKAGDSISVEAKVWIHNLKPEDIAVQLYVGQIDYHGEITGKPLEMKHAGVEGSANLYEYTLTAEDSGRHDYAMRVIPKNENLAHPFTPLYLKWED
jgi:starch phosphorylase